MYKVVFWTGSINSHSSYVIDEFAKNNDVIIAYAERSFRNFTNFEIKHCKLTPISNKEDIISLVKSTKDYIHINNCFKVNPKYKIIKIALKLLVKENLTIISLFQEQYPYKGFIGKLRQLKWYWIYNYGLGSKHKLIGYCGQIAKISLIKSCVCRDKLFDFIYTPWYQNITEIKTQALPTFIMVGQLVRRKEILRVIQIFRTFNLNFKFKIIGDGVLRNKIISLIENDKRFEFLGSLQPFDVQKQYAKSDLLILASSFDGWGCSVNEAMSQGCRVLVSNSCGSSSLVSPKTGSIFKAGNWQDFRGKVQLEILKLPLSLKQKQEIIEYSQNISPEAEAIHLNKIFDFYFKKKERPTPPWS